jgi:Zn ribbon nucleic-acid-binding protein
MGTPFKKVAVECPGCGWKGRRLERASHEWRGRWVPICLKCGYHPVRYASK